MCYEIINRQFTTPHFNNCDCVFEMIPSSVFQLILTLFVTAVIGFKDPGNGSNVRLKRQDSSGLMIVNGSGSPLTRGGVEIPNNNFIPFNFPSFDNLYFWYGLFNQTPPKTNNRNSEQTQEQNQNADMAKPNNLNPQGTGMSNNNNYPSGFQNTENQNVYPGNTNNQIPNANVPNSNVVNDLGESNMNSNGINTNRITSLPNENNNIAGLPGTVNAIEPIKNTNNVYPISSNIIPGSFTIEDLIALNPIQFARFSTNNNNRFNAGVSNPNYIDPNVNTQNPVNGKSNLQNPNLLGNIDGIQNNQNENTPNGFSVDQLVPSSPILTPNIQNDRNYAQFPPNNQNGNTVYDQNGNVIPKVNSRYQNRFVNNNPNNNNNLNSINNANNPSNNGIYNTPLTYENPNGVNIDELIRLNPTVFRDYGIKTNLDSGNLNQNLQNNNLNLDVRSNPVQKNALPEEMMRDELINRDLKSQLSNETSNNITDVNKLYIDCYMKGDICGLSIDDLVNLHSQNEIINPDNSISNDKTLVVTSKRLQNVNIAEKNNGNQINIEDDANVGFKHHKFDDEDDSENLRATIDELIQSDIDTRFGKGDESFEADTTKSIKESLSSENSKNNKLIGKTTNQNKTNEKSENTESSIKKQEHDLKLNDCQIECHKGVSTAYDPFCGSDNITYSNSIKVACALKCGKSISASTGACENADYVI